MLWADPQGRLREDCTATGRAKYQAAFDAIKADPNAHLFVMTRAEEVIGCAQINILAGLSYSGTTRGLIEDVRVREDERGQGHGRRLLEHLCNFATAQGCGLVELFVHQDRDRAHYFYRELGFTQSHFGFRRTL
ncbi:Aminoalkylphosphonate N-acetyltransferase [Pontivivens insulae]|uniref:Aminoalkylphosphonate N-acetyltransferase n=2 Tax=Pontivivens insulae TaxID=1639689 RepID=A0A2R8AE44_9RHOB|nr:Aminoalkylphosphonate N-acetyltransferase [Pontivivens insulae]